MNSFLGSVGANFWVLLRGSVSVIIDVEKKIAKGEKGDKISQLIPTEIKVLQAGTAFGELALINSKPRSATIQCKEDCDFAVLEKVHFDEILRKIFFLQLQFKLFSKFL